MLIYNMIHKQTHTNRPPASGKSPYKGLSIIPLCVCSGGGVALRINITAAAVDSDKPQTGSTYVADQERESGRDMDAASELIQDTLCIHQHK